MTSDNNQEAVKAWIDKKTGRYYIDLRGAPAGAELIQINITPIESKEPVSPVAEPLTMNDSVETALEKMTKLCERLNAKIKADAVEIERLNKFKESYHWIETKFAFYENKIHSLEEENGNLKEIIENKKFIIQSLKDKIEIIRKAFSET